jgi:hypothetical protein
MASGTRLCVSLVVLGVLAVLAPASASTRAAARTVSPEGAVYTFGSGPSGEAVLTIDDADLHVEKTVGADGSSSVAMRAGDDEVRIEVAQERVSVSTRDGRVSFVPDGTDEKGETAVRVALARSPVVQRFRSFAARATERGRKTAYEQGIALSAALVGQLAGDPGALRSFARRHRPAEGRVRQISARRITDCWGQYESYISWAWDQYLYCLTGSRSLLMGSLSYCEFQYYMRAESAWFQFLSCSAIPVV